ncbi:hypothetical protein [Paenibacillus sp. NPDC055715]
MQQLWGTSPGAGTVERRGGPRLFNVRRLVQGILLQIVRIPMINLQFASK